MDVLDCGSKDMTRAWISGLQHEHLSGFSHGRSTLSAALVARSLMVPNTTVHVKHALLLKEGDDLHGSANDATSGSLIAAAPCAATGYVMTLNATSHSLDKCVCAVISE